MAKISKSNKKWHKKLLIGLCCIIAIILVIILCYVAYVFGTYHRIPDRQKITIQSPENTVSTEKVSTNTLYTKCSLKHFV